MCQIGFYRGEVFVFAKEQLRRGCVCGGFADCTRYINSLGKLGIWRDIKVIYQFLLTASMLFQIHIVGGG